MRWMWRRCGIVMFALPGMLLAQSQSSGAGGDGAEFGGYQVQQSIELGYRFTDVNGSKEMYNTFLNQQQGPRILDQSLTMTSPEHTGAWFDDLSVSSFGWGGDPENVARARLSKYGKYDFTALFRRDKNYFDYNLFANPLNPPTSTPSIPVDFSPHSMFTTRRMYDYGLTILPQSKFSIRLGFSRNRAEGPSFSSFHEGTDVLLNQPWNFTSNEYRIGFDYRGIRATTISYDQFVMADKNDTDYSLATFQRFDAINPTTLDKIPVELGLPWNTQAGSPCTTPFTGGTANPSCNEYISYSRTQRVRSTTPTEQLSINSNYFRRLNFVGHVSYSSGTSDSPYNESFNGLVTRNGERQFILSGPASIRRIGTVADFSATFKVSGHFDVSNTFRFENFRIPGQWNSTETTTNAVAVPPVSIFSDLGATTITTDFILNFMGQKSYYNRFQLEYSPSKHFGARLGYSLRHRHLFKAEPESLDPEAPFEGFEGDSIDVNEHGPVAGVWFRPTDAVRANFDVELTTADNFFTRISPRQRQNYRGRVTYKAAKTATVTGSMNFWEARNGESDTSFKQHYRNVGFVATLLPTAKFNLDLSYNYTNSLQSAYICYNGTFLAPGTVALGCPTADTTDNPNPNWIYSKYADNTHYFNATVMTSPMKRVRVGVGYGLVKTDDGGTTILNPLQPLATLQFTYHQPTASVSYDATKNVSLNAYWNYDQYNEDSFVGPTLPRYFHDNRSFLSARYSF